MHRHALPAAAVAAVLVVSGPLLWGGGVDLPDDALYYGVASWEWLARAARDGVSPFWVSGKLGGVSLFSDVVPQGPFYPFAWLGLVLPVIPAMGLAAVLHALGTLLAMRWLARLHGIRAELAWLAGAGVAAGPLAVWAAIDFQVDAWPTFLWFPVVLGCLLCSAEAARLGDRRSWMRWVALGGMATALLLLGSHLRLGIAAGAALALWAVVRGRDLPGAAATGALGLLAGAPAYVPMLLEARAQGSGGGLPSLGSEPDLALGFWNAAGWLTPKVMLFDRDLGVGTVLGVGALAAVLALVRVEARWRRLAWFAGLLLLAGTRIPGARQLAAPLTLLTHPVNLVYPALALFPLALLGAGGLEWMLERRPRGTDRQLLVGAVGALLALAVLRIVLGGVTFPSGMTRALYGLALAQVAVVGTLAVRVGRTGSPGAQLLALLAIADLALFGVRAHLAVPSGTLRATSDVRGDRTLLYEGYIDAEDLSRGFEGATRDDDDAPSDRRRAEREQANEEEVVAYEVEAPAVQRRLLQRVWPVHAGMALHVEGIAGRSKVMPARTAALLRPVAERLADLAARELDADVLAHVFAPGGPGWRLLEVFGARTAVWEHEVFARRPRSDGACRLLTETTVEPAEDRRVAALLDRAGARSPALLEAPLPDGPPLGPAQMMCSAEGATVTLDVTVPPGRRGLLAVRRPLHPGWLVGDERSGAPLVPFPVDQVHQGVLLDEGTYRLQWSFAPPGLLASLAAAGCGWLVLLGLLAAGRRARAAPPSGALGRAVVWAGITGLGLAAGPGIAEATEGTLIGAEPGVSYEVLVTSSLDLSDPAHVRARAPLTPERPDFVIPTPAGPSWVFLRQEIVVPDGPPLTFFRPADLLPLAPDDRVTLRAVPRDLALLRRSGQAAPGWWRVPALLVLALLGMPLLRRGLLRGETGAEVRPAEAAPLAASPRARPSSRERLGLGLLVLLALALRLPGFTDSLDLLEWSYGPGTARVVPVGDGDVSLLASMADALLRPPSLELVHPPLWHWLLQAVDAASGGAEWALRLPALVASIATVVAAWWLLRGLGPRAGLLAAAGLAIAPPAVHFGRDATPYALLGFACLGSLILLLRALRSGTVAAWAAWLGLLAVSFLCHYGTVFFAGAQAVGLAWLAVRAESRRPFRLALAQASRAAVWTLPLPVAWTCLHFAHFAATALDTRLYADTYPLDPGPVRFLTELGSVGFGMPPTLSLAAVGLLGLGTLGLRRLRGDHAPLALLLGMTCLGFGAGCWFFYANLVGELGGRVFWGFRWVSWFLPVAIGLAAAGVERAWTWVPAIGWAVAALAAPWVPGSSSTRPDYRGAAAVIAADLQDRDGLATLPLWGERGPVRTYLTRAVGGSFTTVHDTTAWDLGGRAAYLEMIDERFPFETTAKNGHVDRIWLVVPDERMFGREKFRAAIAVQALAWAKKELRHVRTVELDHLSVSLFARPELRLPASLEPTTLPALRNLEPNSPPCGADDDRWSFVLRGTIDPSSHPADERVRVERGAAHLIAESGTPLLIRIEGGPCSEPPPIVRIGR
jgi:hypothetical protein